ncbi:MAG TPA: glucose 1-dehydrogenase, partial [Candidatus Binataceae bacterium]|nr:glucose 1-dehydrogenase [Candidatus Binataceae bacterium]
MKLANKVALITGAGSGMGRVASVLFASEGARIACIDVDEKGAQETVKTIERDGGKAFACKADVSRSADVAAMVAATAEKLGPPNILYNNAGIEGSSSFLANMPDEDFDRVIAINLRGVWLGMKHTLPHMIKNGGGSIINTASIAGLVGLKGAAAYCAAKAGVIALTRVAALEYGRYNIRVNAICPGAIDTPMVQRVQGDGGLREGALNRISVLGRIGKPEEIARTALFLASDDASFATGAPFIIDGGWT